MRQRLATWLAIIIGVLAALAALIFALIQSSAG